ncbi:MAG: short-chain dehydrogenase/reductase, partial [Acidimicrobiia bacterium]|nr:short-chain dehydrogenase/reductase [Acidimicrobiia bacterium]
MSTSLPAGALDGQVAIVTGAARGIGRSTVEALAALGAAVALVDIDADALERATTELTAAGHRVAAVVADLADIASVDAVLPRCEEALAPVSILVNNAGILSGHHLLDVEVAEWERVLAVNLTAPWRLTQAVGRS